MNTQARAILDWAMNAMLFAGEHNCTLIKFVLPEDFKSYLHVRMMTDKTVQASDYNVEPAAVSGVTKTTLLGVPVHFANLPHGKTLFLYKTSGVHTVSGPELYPGDKESA